jgi:hypothetical protein
MCLVIVEKHAKNRFRHGGFGASVIERHRSRSRYFPGPNTRVMAAIGQARAERTSTSGSLPLLLSVRSDGNNPGH